MAQRESLPCTLADVSCPPAVCLDLPTESCRLGALATRERWLTTRNSILERTTHDRRVPGFLNSAGAIALIEQNPEIAQQIDEGEIVIEFGDGRNLKPTNAKLGMRYGHIVIAEQGIRMGQCTRTSQAELSRERLDAFVERRYPKWHDIGGRDSGADEMYVVAAADTLEDAELIRKRLAHAFSAEKAMEDDRNGIVPILANFVAVHATEVAEPLTREQTERLSVDDLTRIAVQTFEDMLSTAETRMNQQEKDKQYIDMWKQYDRLVRGSGGVSVDPVSNAHIAELFMEHCTPNFYANQRAMLDALTPAHDFLRKQYA